MRETKQKQIGARGYTYHVTQFGAREGGRVIVRLLKMLGGALGSAVKADDAENAVGFDVDAIGNVIANIAETVTEADFDFLVDTFAKCSSVSGGDYRAPAPLTTEGIFDLHFAGAYVELGEWLLFAIEVNFGSFLGESGLVRRASAATSARPVSAARAGSEPSKSRSPNISATSGRSGA